MLRQIICLFAIASTLFGNIEVTNLNDEGQGSLREALTFAVDQERITFAPELAGETIQIETPLPVITHTITIFGPDEGITVRGNGKIPLLIIDGQAPVLKDVHFTNGYGEDTGAAISLKENAILSMKGGSITNCVSEGETAGAVLLEKSSIFVFIDTQFANNESTDPGKDIRCKDLATVASHCQHADISVDVFGEAIYSKKGPMKLDLDSADSSALTIIIVEGEAFCTGEITGPTMLTQPEAILSGDMMTEELATSGKVKISPANGSVHVISDFIQTKDGTLEFTISSDIVAPLIVGGNATLAGTLSLVFEEKRAHPGSVYTILTTNGLVNQTFDQVITNGPHCVVQYHPDRVDVRVTGKPKSQNRPKKKAHRPRKRKSR